MRTLTPAELPIDTIDMIDLTLGASFSVSKATAWADAILEHDVTDEPILAVYLLDSSDGYACADLIPDLLRSVGAWREDPVERLGLKRDLLLQGLLDGRLSARDFARETMLVAIELSELGETARAEATAYYTIEDTVDYASAPSEDPVAKHARLLAEGYDITDPRPWIFRVLRDAHIVDEQGRACPPTWV